MSEPEISDTEKPSPGAVNKATVRIFQVLAAFVRQSEPCGVTDLSRQLGMTKSMVHRALMTLEEQGYVSRNEHTSLYQLGHRLIELSSPAESELTVHDLVAPFLKELVDIAGETVVVMVPAGRRVIIVGGMEGRQAISLRVSVGAMVPLHVLPAGRCILANLPSDDISRYFMHPLERYTEFTMVEPGRLRNELDGIRRRGHCMGVGDLSAGTASIGFPVLDADSTPHGAISVTGPADRFRDRMAIVLPQLEAVVAEMHRNSRLYRTTAVLGAD